ncbi:FAD-dependent oxidoreductase [Chloroflexi bacterium TSY]|nr:FAD-dependent oxidoreductase [Chloroflexi bacterium TSY]
MTTRGTNVGLTRVAIIGAGPSGFYAAGALFDNFNDANRTLTVDMYDRLPPPYGLVRYGVAPDHQKIKAVVKLFERIAMRPNFRFFGNVSFGTDITHAELRTYYDAIIYAVGAQSDRSLNIPGEDLPGSLSATEFVAWYNGHPDYVNLSPDLSSHAAVVVGVGNVAMDVARILAKSPEELAETDITDYALAALSQSKIKDIYILSRRGPVQAKFTPAEVKEFGELDEVDVIVEPNDLILDPASTLALEKNRTAKKNLEHLAAFAERKASNERRVLFKFLCSPVELLAGDEQESNHKVAKVRIEKNRLEEDDSGYIASIGTGEYETLSAGLVLRSVGYRGIPLPGVPFDQRRGIIPNEKGRVLDPETRQASPGEYVVGWIKRGPTGIIGTNKPDAVESVKALLADLSDLSPAKEPDPAAVEQLLRKRDVAIVTFGDWNRLDALEVEAGSKENKPRVKFTSVDQMLNAVQQAEA